VSAYRIPVDTAAGGFATLIVLLPWEVWQAAGMHELPATYLGAGLLLVMALGALLLRRSSVAQQSYRVPFFGEDFRIASFLLAFALFALAELVLAGLVVCMYWTLPPA
jgi:hypothetical protein